jgi:monofunctional biosynthetic peptidoglycan transglycosylase
MGNESEHRTRPQGSRRVWKFVWKAIVFCLVFPIFQVAILKFVDPPVTVMMLWQSMEHLFAGSSPGFVHFNIDHDHVSPSFYQAVIAGEDQRFFTHSGFDFVELEKAQRAHARNPKKAMRGASTISQQVAKNLFLPPWRNIIRKGVEAYYTFWIELLWSKERILEMYGNIVELAPHIYGVEAGAQYHFRKPAAKLTSRESALLAAILANPKRWNASKPTGYIQRRSARIARQMIGLPVEDEYEQEQD